jgi:hypothetical protein
MRPPLQGYNHNIGYRNNVFHVQTEDSGVKRPHLITHLFLDGSIVATLRTDYSQLVDDPDHTQRVRKMMQEQHKAIMYQLRRGELDEQIASLSEGPAVPLPTDTSEEEKTNVTRGQRISQQTQALKRESGELAPALPEFGTIPFIELEGADEALELDLEAIAALDLDQGTPAEKFDPMEPTLDEALEVDPSEWDDPEPTPVVWDRELELQVQVRVSTPSRPTVRPQPRNKPEQPKKTIRRRSPSRPLRAIQPKKKKRQRKPSLPVATGTPVDEGIFRQPKIPPKKKPNQQEDEGLFWEPSDPKKDRDG